MTPNPQILCISFVLGIDVCLCRTHHGCRALFYYAGAASAAGQSYNGAVLVTADGTWPAEV